tara:strand:- start:1678 stop:2217 length:540 start_codon:yes stop_codon:yes gene_type:complete
LRWTNNLILVIALCFFSCEIPDQNYNDPLDLDYNSSKGILPPAFIFSPDQISTSVSQNIALELHALEVDKVAGSQIKIAYNPNKVSLVSISQGDWLIDNGQSPIFFYENNSTSGMIDIYYSVLGSSENLSGTGVVAYLSFTVNAPGPITISIDGSTRIVDKDNQPIQLNGLGKVAITTQ